MVGKIESNQLISFAKEVKESIYEYRIPLCIFLACIPFVGIFITGGLFLEQKRCNEFHINAKDLVKAALPFFGTGYIIYKLYKLTKEEN